MEIWIVVICPKNGTPSLLGAFTDPEEAMKLVFNQEETTTVTKVTVTIYKA